MHTHHPFYPRTHFVLPTLLLCIYTSSRLRCTAMRSIAKNPARQTLSFSPSPLHTNQPMKHASLVIHTPRRYTMPHSLLSSSSLAIPHMFRFVSKPLKRETCLPQLQPQIPTRLSQECRLSQLLLSNQQGYCMATYVRQVKRN
jgi:hypothetical protein